MTEQHARFQAFLEGYVSALLWSDHPYDGDGDSSDDNWIELGFCGRDLDQEALASIVGDCGTFLALIPPGILTTVGQYRQAGHDFLLTRNSHGAGFWDGDWDEEDPHGDLDRVAKLFNETSLGRGRDDRLELEEGGLRPGVINP